MISGPSPLLPSSDGAQQPSVELPRLVRTVFRLSRRFKDVLNGPLEKRLGLNIQELLCLASIDSGYDTPSRLAQQQGVPAPSMSRMLTRLEKHELVRRGEVTGDLRRCRLTLTDEGQRLRERLRAEVETTVQATYTDLDPALVSETLQALLRLEKALGGTHLPPTPRTTTTTANNAVTNPEGEARP